MMFNAGGSTCISVCMYKNHKSPLTLRHVFSKWKTTFLPTAEMKWNPGKSRVRSYLFYSAVAQTEGAWPPSSPTRTPRGTSDCPWRWTSPAPCPSARRWLLGGSDEGGSTGELKLESSRSYCRTRSKSFFHKGVLSAQQWPLRSRVQGQYLPWSLEMSGLYQNLDVSWTNFTVSCLLPKSARHRLKLDVRFQTGFGPNIENMKRERLVKGSVHTNDKKMCFQSTMFISNLQILLCADDFFFLVWNAWILFVVVKLLKCSMEY